MTSLIPKNKKLIQHTLSSHSVTCTGGYYYIAQPCMSNDDCGDGGFCSMNQEDTYPSGGNNCGDACECEADFNGDGNVASDDIMKFLADFGRNIYNNPCTAENPCNGDWDCDGNVSVYDILVPMLDFGRNIWNNPCPESSGVICEY